MAGARPFAGLYYDWGDADFKIFAERDGLAFQKAEKSHDIGESLLNSLFKNTILTIDDTEENQCLVDELEHLIHGMKKTKAKDDAIDAMRYAAVKIPWDLTVITGKELVVQTQERRILTTDELRAMKFEEAESWGIEEEIAEWNELLEA
jgi:hypothetical protein